MLILQREGKLSKQTGDVIVAIGLRVEARDDARLRSHGDLDLFSEHPAT